MTASGGGTCEADERLVVAVDPAPVPRPVDVTLAVHRMRAVDLNDAWHRLLADVFDHCREVRT